MERIAHTFSPVYDSDSQILILGSFPSVKSRELSFYYGHPRNRFWKLLSELLQEPLPLSIEEKKFFLLSHHIALWDVIESCEIKGSSDSSIKNVIPNDILSLTQKAPIKHIYANGSKAYSLYEKYCKKDISLPITKLPSTSPANAAFPIERLKKEWSYIFVMTKIS